MKFIENVHKKYSVIAGDVVHLTQIPKFKKGLEKRERQEHNQKVLDLMKAKKGETLKKTGSDDSSSPPSKLFKKIDFDAPAKIKASTMSVLMAGKSGKADTAGVSVSIRNKGGAEEYANLTLRFDQEDYATLCGYPQDWAVWDEKTDHYDSESMTMEEWLDADDGFPDHITAYVSRDSEKEILKQLKASVQKQFKDPRWKDTLDNKQQKLVITMIDKAIQRL